MLLRAFGPPGKPRPRPFDASRLWDSARALDLSARIAARFGDEALRGEIGEAADPFLRDARRCADESIVQSLAAQDVAVAARFLSIPLVYLKFQALVAGGFASGGARGTSDVDVLVPQGEAERLRRALLGRGYHASGSPAYEHQTSALVHPYGVSVDIHRKLLGVRVTGSRSADARALIDRGLCAPLAGTPGEPFLPVPSVLIAHALAHGIAQNGLSPDAYPLLRMISDLIDLGFPGAPTESASWVGWLCRDVSAREVTAVGRLAACLLSGEDPEAAGADALAFLLHVAAAAADPSYSRSLALKRLLREPTDHSRLGKLARSAGRALFPPREALRRIGRAIR